MHPSHKVPWCLPNPPGQVFAFKVPNPPGQVFAFKVCRT